MIVRLPLIINGEDFSSDVKRLGYEIVFEDRTGGNTRTMRNGDEYIDLLARKPVISWELDSLPGTRLAALHRAIDYDTYVSVTYFDTRINDTATADFHGTISSQKIGVIRAGWRRFYGPVLKLRAR